MMELPEVKTKEKQLKETVLNKKIIQVVIDKTPHKLAFYEGDLSQYESCIKNKRVTEIGNRNFYIELVIEEYTLLFRDGINLTYGTNFNNLPDKYALLIIFDDKSYLVATIAMYGWISLFPTGTYENEYYNAELYGVSPISKEFTFEYFNNLIDDMTMKLSAKGFLATKQRILGIGNGVVQDILFQAKIHPKTKIMQLTTQEIECLYTSIVQTLMNMIEGNGRDTEKDLYGNNGNYSTILSRNSIKFPCRVCGSKLMKQTYLGGAIYFCPRCQPQKK